MIRLLILFLAVLSLPLHAGPNGAFLNVAILELPDRYLADVPRERRVHFLSKLSELNDDRMLDYANGRLHSYGDGESSGETSQLYIKLLPRGRDRNPLVFVHMAKPFADGRPPGLNQTFVLERRGVRWIDVTTEVIPRDVDLALHFRPWRGDGPAIVEVAEWRRMPRRDRRGHAYGYGRRILDLHWNGRRFEPRKAGREVLSN